MAVDSSREAYSLNGLNTDILVSVLKETQRRRKPIKYHTIIRITWCIIAPQVETCFPAGIAIICAYTRHVNVDSDLNVEHVKRLMKKIERLSSISDFSTPSDIIPLRHINSREVKLYVESLPLQEFVCQQQVNPYLRAISAGNLVSLRMATATLPLTARITSLKGLLLSSPQLETLWYEGRARRASWISSVWKTLCLNDLSVHLPDRRHDATRSSNEIIKQIRALLFPLDGILKHARSLRSLRFRNCVGFADEKRRYPTMGVEDLDILSQKLGNLRWLELDLDEKPVALNPFLLALCRARQLLTLILHIQTILEPLEDIDVDLDHNR
ncbi:hypothetical protein GGS21DRAFT_538149 [Xylaria nigripes]|nr:hypothetical protein GGS21DRAFT_538149 [Xylaria nigripes]